ncbi:hypothetical protein [Flavobacterium ranwuense]|uniref:hypothetical protein n=1 Tax=Flavobacterium ranwuense TaxID=2541725 RepID=UPI001404B3C2|nr:hypothetical protein [Flavobacterium ranwuense]
MKKKTVETTKKLSLEKFKIAELKNPKAIVGGNADDGGGVITADPTKISRG